MFLKTFLNNFCGVTGCIICCKRPLPLWSTITMKRTESFLAEHCPEHCTVLANLPSSRSLSSAIFLSGKCYTQPSMWCRIKCDSSDQDTLFIVSYFSSDAHKPIVGDFGGVISMGILTVLRLRSSIGSKP